MLDIFNIPSNTDNTKIFYAQGATTWQTWQKPRGAKMIQIFCLGSGGSGGIGSAALNGGRTGGGGAGSGAITRALIPAFLLPDILYIQVGLGGAALNQTSTTVVAGIAGAHSYISLAPSTAASTVVIASSTVVAVGGLGSIGANAAGATVFTPAVGVFAILSIFNTVAGVIGTGLTAVPTPGPNQAALGSSIVTGGTAGGPANTNPPGTGYNGGSITSASVILTSTVAGGTGISTAGTTAPAGADGYTIMNPFCSTGGAGGAGNGAGTGGWGGNGGLGSGGGGGGASAQNGTRRSGKGGDGLVIITTIT